MPNSQNNNKDISIQFLSDQIETLNKTAVWSDSTTTTDTASCFSFFNKKQNKINKC